MFVPMEVIAAVLFYKDSKMMEEPMDLEEDPRSRLETAIALLLDGSIPRTPTKLFQIISQKGLFA